MFAHIRLLSLLPERLMQTYMSSDSLLERPALCRWSRRITDLDMSLIS